jgi:hypothetical protein
MQPGALITELRRTLLSYAARVYKIQARFVRENTQYIGIKMHNFKQISRLLKELTICRHNAPIFPMHCTVCATGCCLPPPLSLGAAKAGRNHPPPHRIGERYSQTLSYV